MKTFKIIFLALIFFQYSNSYAQIGKNELNYSLKRNDPNNMKNLSLTFVPLQFDFYSFNNSMGLSIGGEYEFKNFFAFGVDFYYAYSDQWGYVSPFEKRNLTPPSDYSTSNATDLRIYARFIVNSTEKEVIEEVYLKSDRGIKYVTKIPVKRVQQIAIRLGYNMNSFFANCDNSSNYTLEGKAVDLLGNQDYIMIRDAGAMMTNQVLTLGVSRIRKMDLTALFNKGYGEKKVNYRNEMYFDIMYAVNQNFQNIYLPYDTASKVIPIEYEVNEKTDRSAFGFRVGYRHTSLQTWGFNYNIETGFRPGPGTLVRNFFLTFGLGINISTKI